MASSPTFLLDGTQPGFVHLIDRTLSTPQANLNLDATLFQQAEQAGESEGPQESLRFWESPEYCVVLGHSSREAQDVCREACERAGVPVLRRISGGGTVLLGPGCLNFSLVLSLIHRPQLGMVRQSMKIILDRVARGVALSSVRRAGISDLVLGGRKFSGNAQRRGRRALLHHGTILYAFDISRVGEFLREPSRQPAYRAQRTHGRFLYNIPVDVHDVRIRFAQAWDAHSDRMGFS